MRAAAGTSLSQPLRRFEKVPGTGRITEDWRVRKEAVQKKGPGSRKRSRVFWGPRGRQCRPGRRALRERSASVTKTGYGSGARTKSAAAHGDGNCQTMCRKKLPGKRAARLQPRIQRIMNWRLRYLGATFWTWASRGSARLFFRSFSALPAESLIDSICAGRPGEAPDEVMANSRRSE